MFFTNRYKEEQKRIQQLPEVVDKVQKYRKTMDYLTYHSGKPIDDTGDVAYLYNLLKEEVFDLSCYFLPDDFICDLKIFQCCAMTFLVESKFDTTVLDQ